MTWGLSPVGRTEVHEDQCVVGASLGKTVPTAEYGYFHREQGRVQFSEAVPNCICFLWLL